MGLQITGRYTRTTTREVKPTETGRQFEPFTEVQFVIEDWGQTYYVSKGRDFDADAMPEVGSQVVMSVVPKASGTRVYFTGIAVRLDSTGGDAAGAGRRAASSPAA